MSRAIFGLALVLLAGPARATCWDPVQGGCDSYYENQRRQVQYQLQRQREAIQQLQQQQQGSSGTTFPNPFQGY